jgi:hypothetical protein
VDNIQLPQDRRSIIRQNHLLQVIDNDLVATIRAKGRLDSLGNRSTRFDISQNRTILALVTGLVRE